MKKSTIKFALVILAILLSFPLIKAHAQQTSLKDVYLDVNGNITISWLSDKPAAHGELSGVLFDTAAIAQQNYPLSGQMKVTIENGLYRITVYNLYYKSSRFSMPVESFALSGKHLTRNKKRQAAVRLMADQVKQYLSK